MKFQEGHGGKASKVVGAWSCPDPQAQGGLYAKAREWEAMLRHEFDARPLDEAGRTGATCAQPTDLDANDEGACCLTRVLSGSLRASGRPAL